MELDEKETDNDEGWFGLDFNIKVSKSKGTWLLVILIAMMVFLVVMSFLETTNGVLLTRIIALILLFVFAITLFYSFASFFDEFIDQSTKKGLLIFTIIVIILQLLNLIVPTFGFGLAVFIASVLWFILVIKVIWQIYKHVDLNIGKK